MTFSELLARSERANGSMLCVGLDPDPAKFPGGWRGDASRIFDFCRAIVDATRDLVIAFKPQIAYFAAERAEDQLEALIAHIHASAPGVPVILDAKRGDIGATAERYAREVFERYRADAVTLSPFMGFDSIEPYLAYPDKGLLLLCRTSNPGGADLQTQALASGDLLYEHVARLAANEWNRHGQLGLVVGATFPAELARVRSIAPHLPLLIPGIGAQGGDAAATVRAAWRGAAVVRQDNPDRPAGSGDSGSRDPRTGPVARAPVIVSSSRAVLYASGADDFAVAARRVAMASRDELAAARTGGPHS